MYVILELVFTYYIEDIFDALKYSSALLLLT